MTTNGSGRVSYTEGLRGYFRRIFFVPARQPGVEGTWLYNEAARRGVSYVCRLQNRGKIASAVSDVDGEPARAMLDDEPAGGHDGDVMFIGGDGLSDNEQNDGEEE